MNLRRAVAGLLLLTASFSAFPNEASASVLNFDMTVACQTVKRLCPEAGARRTEGQGGLTLILFRSRFGTQAAPDAQRGGPPPDRIPFDSPPGNSGDAPGTPPILVTPLPGGGLLMLTALGIVVLIRRQRFAAALD
ncbi:hypothetical protein [Ovoidimarina sediminis]|uniref:hypothetical protein n=1 Tax=Ovoidimarina sediminis TaxID=3079856 RepID=UPI0029145D46|nr:hypothetical protein [Rhodophyticola sp. MJ-SS7]MDU8945004.1 hypothetical protein [Rhodophyticola sp. MJ-SS7]